MDLLALLVILASGALAVYSIVRLGRTMLQQNLHLGYVWLVSIGAALATLFLSRSLQNTYLVAVVAIPFVVFAFVQLPLVVFRAKNDPREDTRDQASRSAALLILAIVLMEIGLALLEPPGSTAEWRSRLVILTVVVGFWPLMASTYLLMKTGWNVAKPWGLGLNVVTAPAVLPAFVQTHPKEAWPPTRRFLFWFAIALGPAYVDSLIGNSEAIYSVGYLLFTVGGLAAMGAFVWLLVALLTRRHDILRSLATLAAAVTVWMVGILIIGDLVIDRNAATKVARSFADRAFGCAGNEQHATLLIDWSKRPLQDRLRFVPLDAARGSASGSVDPAMAQRLAVASALVYMTPCDMQEATRHWDISGLQVIPIGSPGDKPTDCDKTPARDQAVILADERNLVVAFRGTDQLADWATNLSFVPKSLLDGAWTHAGFEEALDRLWRPVLSTVQQVRGNNRTVWVTGHSLGGALAILAANRLTAAGIPVDGVYTFGQPLVAGESVAESLNKQFPNYYRFVMHSDMVPSLGTLGAVHAGNLRYIDTLGNVHVSVDLRTSAMDGICGRLSFGPIEAHGMLHYLSEMELGLVYAVRRSRG